MEEESLLNRITAPKEILDEFAEMAEEENIDPFAETKLKNQIAHRQSDYHKRRFDIDRSVGVSADPFKQGEAEGDGDTGYKEAMRLAKLEKEEQRVRRLIEEKEQKERDENQMKLDGDKTPPAASRAPASEDMDVDEPAPKKKRRWDVSDEEKKADTGEWSQQALEEAAPKKRRSRWDATPADVAASGEAPKKSRWDQAPTTGPIPIITTAPLNFAGTMAIPGAPFILTGNADIDKHNRYLTDEELDAVLPTSGYVIVTPPEGYVAAQPAR
ncbi:hypothetical protein FRB99_002584, partial [Tulasnella sp. 403]